MLRKSQVEKVHGRTSGHDRDWGILRITSRKVPDNFSEYWKNNFLVLSLAGKTIYRILFDKNFSKAIYNEKIFIGKKMRDIAYSEEFNVFLIALEGSYGSDLDISPSIGI